MFAIRTFLAALLGAALASSSLVSAQNATSPAGAVGAMGSTGASNGTGTNHIIMVGMSATGTAAKAFTPSNITANVGDTVTFMFTGGNHTVSQSTFASPCSLLQNNTANQVGFDSGFVPVNANSSTVPTWTLQVKSMTPIWFYCAQAGHCQSGMVGAINAVESSSKASLAGLASPSCLNFEAYLAAAKNSASTTANGTTGAGVAGTAGSTTGAGGTAAAATAGAGNMRLDIRSLALSLGGLAVGGWMIA